MTTVTDDSLNKLRTQVGAMEAAVTTITIREMNELAAKIADLRDEEKKAGDIKKAITTDLESCENRMTELLLENGMQNYRSPSGLVGLSFRTSVRQPQGIEREKFYEFLKREGKFETMISINSQTLNSFYKEQFELAKERGEDDFVIPGLTEVKINPSLTFKRTK